MLGPHPPLPSPLPLLFLFLAVKKKVRSGERGAPPFWPTLSLLGLFYVALFFYSGPMARKILFLPEEILKGSRELGSVPEAAGVSLSNESSAVDPRMLDGGAPWITSCHLGLCCHRLLGPSVELRGGVTVPCWGWTSLQPWSFIHSSWKSHQGLLCASYGLDAGEAAMNAGQGPPWWWWLLGVS